jgi:hypothetical protein
MLGAGEHVVVRGGDGGTPQEAHDLLQVPFEVGVNPLPRPGPGRGIKAIPGLHAANLSCRGRRRKPSAGTRYVCFERSRQASFTAAFVAHASAAETA